MQRPDRFGLYEPAMEHDACGVGFVAHIKGEKSRSIVEQGLEVLRRLSHRAACGCDPETGDGAGILLQLPHRFFKRVGVELGFDIPPRRSYGVGQVFLPSDDKARAACERAIEEVVRAEGQRIVGWRDVPTDPRHVGRIAAQVVPVFRQVYIARRRLPPSTFERKLYIIRKLIGSRVRSEGLDPQGLFHIASLSSETIVYKGFLLPAQLPQFFPDLQDDAMVSAIALVHSRFSTNTFPAWDLAQPFRFIAHNGEINTLSGNRNWMLARRSLLQSAKFGGPLERLFPIIVPGKSDSAQFDNMLELLHLGGRSLPHSMMMMIPEAWESHEEMSPELRAFYRYAASLLEPWDGPAAIVFTDGQIVGGTLDRNGLRPARYLITEDDRVVLASETGVIDVPPEQVRAKGRLQPGKMFVVDTEEGRIIDDQELKRDIAGRFPFGRWLEKNLLDVDQFPEVPAPDLFDEEGLRRQQQAFGYTEEDVRVLIAPMAQNGEEPVGAMGSDTPLAVLSQFAPNLSNYFHQLFAQVTNPPIDPIRESLVMSLTTTIGPTGNTFDETPEQCHRLKINSPILSSAELAKVASLREGVFEPAKLSMLYYVSEGPEGLERAVDRLCAQAMSAIDDGHNILVLSDRGVDAKRVAVPALLAVAAVHQHLVREGIRMQAGLVVETAAAREVHDFALLIGYGAAAVNPYLALETVRRLCEDGSVDKTPDEAEKNYVHAIEKGILKILSKMGISTLASYRGAHLFEALGLDRALVDKCFTDTPSRIQGVGMLELGTEVLERHRGAFEPHATDAPLPIGGQYQWRRRGEAHMWNPATIAKLQAAASANDPKLFKEYCDLIDGEDRELINLRSLLDFNEEDVTPVPIEEVEPATSIVRRFVTGAMSFGSISAEAHETLAIAMNRIGARSNSGEGGEEEHRFHRDDNGDLRRSAIKQVASARFGVTTNYLVNADDLQIKVAQGAKPGEGGQLPGHKVDERIAKVRHSTPGVTLISPPPHHDIYSIEDLAQLIYDLQTVNPKARVSVKLVSSAGVGTIAAGVAKARAGCVVIAGWDGGTGASPVSSIKHAGVPWELGLAETQQVLIQNDLRRRIRVQVDGGLRTGRDVVIAALLGAEEFGMATAALIVEGCVMMRKCHLNTCSVGIATQDPALRKRFRGNPDHVVNFFFLLVEDVRRRMASLGFRTVDEMVGRVDRLKVSRHREHWKASRIDLSEMLVTPRPFGHPTLRSLAPEPWDLSDHLDHRLIREASGPLEGNGRIELNLPVNNTHRAVGAMLSGEIAKRHGARGLADDAIHVNLTGSAGQSFGAFLARGVTLELAGDANDYLGKGLSGGRVIVYPPSGSRFVPEDNIIIGNTVLYGATSGEVFISGLAGERFAVRNSGANAVVEGVGDHGCEYMTGGRVVVLGTIGRNFAAGMSGGIAYIFDRENLVKKRVNLGMVELESLYDESEIWFIYNMIEEHVRHTGSPLGARLLDNWEHVVPRFVKIMPNDYKRALQAQTVSKARMPGRQRLALVQGGAV
ncbi:MAG: glutamate synthase large subunit [Deltaproteobacteria bacterium]|nr:glutamate synthase large subunit [Deltaproteobacteria bacterium]